MSLRSAVMERLTAPRWPVIHGAAEALSAAAAPKMPGRQGIEFGIPRGGTKSNSLQSGNRQQRLQELYDAYMQCTWVSVCVDTIARTITAGGLKLVPNDGNERTPPANVRAAMRLFSTVNPREDAVQLSRATITDLLVGGDAFIEVGFLGGAPAALYSLDAVGMSINADEHGNIRNYEQIVPGSGGGISKKAVVFEPDEIIHISLDSPRGGLYGVSPTEKCLVLVTAWLFTVACLKERMRKGNPPDVHIDLPATESDDKLRDYRDDYERTHLSPRGIGRPKMTKGGGHVAVLNPNHIADYIETLNNLRDGILSEFGMPPAEANVIETGNIGGGTGESQKKSLRFNTCIPIGNLVLEKLNYHILLRGFGIDDWHLEFPEVDYRDSKLIEDIRTQRLTHGAWSPNRYRQDIGEPSIQGADDPIIMDRGNIVYIRDLSAFTQAEINQRNAPMIAAGGVVPGVSLQPPPKGTPSKAPPPPPEEQFDAGFARRRREAVRELAGRKGSG